MKKNTQTDRIENIFAKWKEASSLCFTDRCVDRTFLALSLTKEFALIAVESIAVPVVVANAISLAATIPGPDTETTTKDAIHHSLIDTSKYFKSSRLLGPDVVGTVEHHKFADCAFYKITAEYSTTPFSFITGSRKTNYIKSVCSKKDQPTFSS